MKEMTIATEAMLTAAEDAPARRGNRTTRVPAILEVAIQVFATQGNGGFTQRRIANDAGIKLRTLQHYFSTRETLLRATIEEMIRRYVERFLAIARDRNRSPAASLNAIVDEAFDMLTGAHMNVSAFALECWALAEHEPFARDMMEVLTGQFQTMFMELVAKVSPALTMGECALRGAQLTSQLYGLAVFLRQAGNNRPDLDAFRQITKVVWKALSEAPQ